MSDVNDNPSRPKGLFARIIDGEIPSHRVFDDAHVYAFLDIGPLSVGHTLVIPKQEVALLHELDTPHAEALGRALPKIAAAVMKATGTTAYNLLQNNGPAAGQEVMHVHFHIIPKPSGRTGLIKEWTPGSIDHAEAARLAEAVRNRLV